MNAQQFIKDHGVDKAREVVEGAPEWAIFWISRNQYHGSVITFPNMTDHYSVDLVELKRLVGSVELVKEHYTLDRAKSYAEAPYTAPEIKERLEQAIADYGQIFGGEHV